MQMNNMVTNRFGHVKWHLGWVVFECCWVASRRSYEDFWGWYSLPQLKNEQINMLMKILHVFMICYTTLSTDFWNWCKLQYFVCTILQDSNSPIRGYVLVVYGKLRTCTWKPAVGASHSVKRTNRKLNGVLCWRKTMLETKKAITFKCDPIIRDYIDINSPSLPQIFTMCVKSDRLKPVIMKMAQQ